MCRWLKRKPRGIYRVLPSAAAIRRRRIVVGEKRKQYHKAYDYLRKRIGFLDYCEYRRNHLPIGSGVTEAACKTVFTQRLKLSGMTWKRQGGAMDRGPTGGPPERHLASSLSGILASEDSSWDGDSREFEGEEAQKSRIILGTGATTPIFTKTFSLGCCSLKKGPVCSTAVRNQFVGEQRSYEQGITKASLPLTC